jgi:hypothetical protein
MGFFGIVYEHLPECFILKDPSSKFLKLFQVGVVVVCGDILMLMALMLGLVDCWQWQRTLVIVGEVFLQLMSHSIVLQLWEPFQKHLSPHQFGVWTLGGCEAIPFGI